MAETETYLGDGLYASFDGFQVVLRTPRYPDVDHWVALEPGVMIAFQRYLTELARQHPELQKRWNMTPGATAEERDAALAELRKMLKPK